MNIPCCNSPSVCSDPATPITNFSSEAADAELFIGIYYGQGLFPPLGSQWESSGCLGVCVSEISQEDADNCAQRQAIFCRSVDWPVDEPNPDSETDPDQPDVVPEPRPIFENEPQSCDFVCPDGNVFTYTVPAGTFSAFSQAAANAIALSTACNKAVNTRICIGDLAVDGACVNSDYGQSVSITVNDSQVPILVSVVSGALPPGFTLENDNSSFTIHGSCPTFGQYTFTVQVEDFDGNFMQKEFTIAILDITQDTLPDGDFGQPYSQTLTVSGGTTGTVTWAVVNGTLPPGLTLNASTGEISGTPTSEGTFQFTVGFTDET